MTPKRTDRISQPGRTDAVRCAAGRGVRARERVTMSGPLDLAGRQFGRLAVVGLAPRETWPTDHRGWPIRSWFVRCSCGCRYDRPVPTGKLTGGEIRSCGCLRLDQLRSEAGRHRNWRLVRKRCRNCGRNFKGKLTRKYCLDCTRNVRSCLCLPYKLCDLCGATFQPIHRRDRWCSADCRGSNRNGTEQYKSRRRELREERNREKVNALIRSILQEEPHDGAGPASS